MIKVVNFSDKPDKSDKSVSEAETVPKFKIVNASNLNGNDLSMGIKANDQIPNTNYVHLWLQVVRSKKVMIPKSQHKLFLPDAGQWTIRSISQRADAGLENV
jgi:hypothetical protein